MEGRQEQGLAQQNGLSMIVLSYERMEGLAALLRSILRQDLSGLDMELILCNNSAKVMLKKSFFSRIGNILRKFGDIKLINSSHNWHCGVRYALGTVAKYETIMFIDDDISIIDTNFVNYMFDTFTSLQPMDIVSCWNTLWVEWNDDYFSNVSLTFTTPGITELIECDTAGPGICMFNKKILLNEEVLRNVICPEFPKADDMGFSLIASMALGSRRYYLPSHGMLNLHEDYRKNALNSSAGHYDDLYAYYKSLFKNGYKPVLAQNSSQYDTNNPEWRATQTLPVVKHYW